MSKLSKSYVAITLFGKERTITDVASLIKKLGERQFLREYGLDHNSSRMARCYAMPYYTNNVFVDGFMNLFPRRGYAYWKDFTLFHCDHLYVLVDGNGKRANPVELVAEYNKLSSTVKAKRHELGTFYNYRSRRAQKGFYTIDMGKNHRMEKMAQGVIEEEGEPPIRKGSYKRSSCYTKYIITEANWKSQRKTQYK